MISMGCFIYGPENPGLLSPRDEWSHVARAERCGKPKTMPKYRDEVLERFAYKAQAHVSFNLDSKI